MGYTLIDYFNAFQNLKRKKRFSSGVQSAYFSILAEFNLRRFPEELELSTRDLQALAGLKSVSTAHEAKNVLKNNKLVDFETKRGTTIYRLLSEYVPNEIWTTKERTVANQPNAGRTPHALVYDTLKPVRGETAERERDFSATETATPRARIPLEGGGFKERGGGTGTASPANPAAQTAAGRQTCGKDADESDAYAHLHERTLPLSSPEKDEREFDAFIDDWNDSPIFCKLDFELISELQSLSQTYGIPALKQAMLKAKKANSKTQGVSFDFFKAVLERQQQTKAQPRLQPQSLKGGETKDEGHEYRYELPPTVTGDEPWSKY